MAFTTDVRSHFKTISQTNTGYFTHRWVRFFWCSCVNTSTYTTALRTCLQCRYVILFLLFQSWLTNQLI